MENHSLSSRYLEFLKMNHLENSEESAKDFCEMTEGISPLMLSMDFSRAAEEKEDKEERRRLSMDALSVYPSNFAAKALLMDLDHRKDLEYKTAFEEEYNRLLEEDYLNPKYYKNGKVDFKDYQETMNLLLPLRNHFIHLIFDGKYEDALSFGEEIRELNPSDIFNNNPILAFLYLKSNDIKAAFELVEEDNKLYPGTKELVYAYACYMNLDTMECLSYLDRMNSSNATLYRLITGELGIMENYSVRDNYADSLYTFMNFHTVLMNDDSDFYKIVDQSKAAHPVLSSLMEDELTVLRIGFLAGVKDWKMENLEDECKSIFVVPDFFTFTTGRIQGILEALTARGILFKDKITPYGRLFLKKIKADFDKKSNSIYLEAERDFQDGKEDEGIKKLVIASSYSPSDFMLRGEYYLRCKELNLAGCEAFIQEMESEYVFDNRNYDFKDYLLRKNCKEILYKVSYRYFSHINEEYVKKGSEYLTIYPKKIPMYENYMNLLSAINGDEEKKNTAIYKLYSTYKNRGQIDFDILKEILRGSLLEISYVMKGHPSFYEIIDSKFGHAYEDEIRKMDAASILTDEEMNFLRDVSNGASSSVKIEILSKLDDAEFLENEGNKMMVASFLNLKKEKNQ